jgi:hypothetical protein
MFLRDIFARDEGDSKEIGGAMGSGKRARGGGRGPALDLSGPGR